MRFEANRRMLVMIVLLFLHYDEEGQRLLAEVVHELRQEGLL